MVYIVDTDGSLHSNADAYDPALCHGNIFGSSLREIVRSRAYLHTVELADARMRATRATCRYHGACSGYYMGEATPEQRWLDDAGNLVCAVAQPMQGYIEKALIEAGLVDTTSDTLLIEAVRSRLEGAEVAAFTG